MAGRFEDATSSERVVDPLAWSWGKSPLGDHGPPIPWRTRMTSRPRLEGSPHSRRHRARAAPEVSEKTYGLEKVAKGEEEMGMGTITIRSYTK